VKLVEPPSRSSTSAIVFIGKNSRGNWVAQEQNGLYGGLFVNRAQAVKYAFLRSNTSRQHMARRMTSRTAVVQESQMVQPHSGQNREQVIDTMIELTRS
jgi:hypothetical protein